MTIQQIIPTLTFYAVSVSSVFLLNYISPSGPCTPGLGLVAFFLLLLSVFALLTKNLYLTWKLGKQHVPVLIIHAIALVVVFIFFN